jgi:hypothetical protein
MKTNTSGDAPIIRPLIRRFLADAALEAVDLANKNVGPTYAAYGVMGHFFSLRAASSLPESFFAHRFSFVALQLALQSAAAEAYEGWSKNGRPDVRAVRRAEPEWLRTVVDFHTNSLLKACDYLL